MTMGLFRKLTVTSALMLSVACTVGQTSVPGLAGPSQLGLLVTLRAIPDSISQDGASQSAIGLTALDPNGRPVAGLPVRMDMAVGGTLQDYGTLSARTIVTGTDGKATTVYTAPPPPPPALGGAGTTVTIVATPTGSNFQTANFAIVTIRLVPPGVILPPAGTPTSLFTFSPAPVNTNVSVTFDGSTSSPGTNSTQITSYAWNFGDGSSGSGKTVPHTFTSAGTFNVTLTVTNNRGLTASSTQAVAVVLTAAPSAKFTISPAAPGANQDVFFNATTSTAASGHALVSYAWDYGDGNTGAGITSTHQYLRAGTFTVTLVVTDDTSQTGSTTLSVTIAAGGSGIVADFVFSPSDPAVFEIVFFDSTPSNAAPNAITSYAWDFGDGFTCSGAPAGACGAGTNQKPQHSFGVAAHDWIIRLTITDFAGRTATVTHDIKTK